MAFLVGVASCGTRASSKWTSALSDDLAEYFATYINEMEFSYNNETLTLDSTYQVHIMIILLI